MRQYSRGAPGAADEDGNDGSRLGPIGRTLGSVSGWCRDVTTIRTVRCWSSGGARLGPDQVRFDGGCNGHVSRASSRRRKAPGPRTRLRRSSVGEHRRIEAIGSGYDGDISHALHRDGQSHGQLPRRPSRTQFGVLLHRHRWNHGPWPGVRTVSRRLSAHDRRAGLHDTKRSGFSQLSIADVTAHQGITTFKVTARPSSYGKSTVSVEYGPTTTYGVDALARVSPERVHDNLLDPA